jgi:hypothetical protein
MQSNTSDRSALAALGTGVGVDIPGIRMRGVGASDEETSITMSMRLQKQYRVFIKQKDD